MAQQTSWRCAECEAIVTTFGESGRATPKCPNCGTPKDPGEGETREVPPRSYDGRAGKRFAELAGPDLDRLLARRVLGGAPDAPPPYSSEDWAAMALADLVGRQSSWSFQLAFCGDAWMATFAEKSNPHQAVPGPPVASFVSASGTSRALAIARALLKVVRSPRWRPVGDAFLSRGFGLTPTPFASA